MASHCPSVGLGVALILLVGTCTAFGDDNCYCRTSTGKHVILGDTACLKTNSGMREARCGMVLNNTAWKFTGKPCPLVSNGGEHGRNSKLATILAR
jgi:hypothetical protein